MRTLFRSFGGSLLASLAGLLLAAVYLWHDTGSAEAVAAGLWIVVVLAVLEVSLSFDNAVVNASVLETMDTVWRKRFLTWGMLFAVFGTRVVFPLAIVGLTAGLGPIDAITLSIGDPERYEAIVGHAHYAIAGFGGAFLLMVGLNFFLDSEKDDHWLVWVEARMRGFAGIEGFGIAVLIVALILVARGLPHPASSHFLVAGLIGLVAFIAVEGLGAWFEARETARALGNAAVRSGLGGFLYLNMLDASFSLDGVIGAFALSNNMVIIAIGLSIGAVFVRSLTMMMVEKATLANYRYLEHGAFWAIAALGVIMLVSTRVHVPEAVTGLIGAVLIGAALYWSVKRREA